MITRHYVPDDFTRKDLQAMRKKADVLCAECDDDVTVYQDEGGQKYLACLNHHGEHWGENSHEGIRRPYIEQSQNYIHAKMEEDMGHELSVIDEELAKRNLPVTGVITDVGQAMEICRTYWPDAPDPSIKAAAYLCKDFGLHPGAKHVFLIPYSQGEGKPKRWEIVTSIGAKRRIAWVVKKARYSYLELTPRIMTEKEEIQVYGKVDKSKVRAITILKTSPEGLECSGAGEIDRSNKVQGVDKGNSLENQAQIRSEARALDRLPGGDTVMPKLDVVDERDMEVIDIEDVGTVNTVTGEIKGPAIIDSVAKVIEEVPPEVPEPPEDLGFCPIHNCPLIPGKGNFPPYCPNKVDGVGRYAGKKVWCKGKPLVTEETLPATDPETQAELPAPPAPEPEQAPEPSLIDLTWLNESLKTLEWSDEWLIEYFKGTYTIEAVSVTDAIAKLDKNKATHFYNLIQTNLDKMQSV